MSVRTEILRLFQHRGTGWGSQTMPPTCCTLAAALEGQVFQRIRGSHRKVMCAFNVERKHLHRSSSIEHKKARIFPISNWVTKAFYWCWLRYLYLLRMERRWLNLASTLTEREYYNLMWVTLKYKRLSGNVCLLSESNLLSSFAGDMKMDLGKKKSTWKKNETINSMSIFSNDSHLKEVNQLSPCQFILQTFIEIQSIDLSDCLAGTWQRIDAFAAQRHCDVRGDWDIIETSGWFGGPPRRPLNNTALLGMRGKKTRPPSIPETLRFSNWQSSTSIVWASFALECCSRSSAASTYS